MSKCIVQGCPNQPLTARNMCKPCRDSLTSGLVHGGIKSFLKCIPEMRMKLFSVKNILESPFLNNTTRLSHLNKMMKDVEGDE